MKILTIGTDRKIFEDGSAVSNRQIKYTGSEDKLNIIVYARRALGLGIKKLSENITVYPTNSASRLLYFIDAVKIAKTLDKPDVVSSQDPFESGVAAYLISRYWRVPLHLQVHTDFLSPYFASGSLLNKIRVLLARFLIKRSDSVRVVTERVKRSITEAGLKEDKDITVLPVFVDTNKIKNAPINSDLHRKYPQFDFIILMASRITAEKNIGMAIGAMAELIKKYPKTGLIIVGDGPEGESLSLNAKRSTLDANIIFEPWNNDLSSYYKTADLFLLTSNYEGYGMTVIEALSAGLPVVMTNVGVAGEVLVHEQNGLIVGAGDLEELIFALDRFMSDKSLRDSINNNVDNMNLGMAEERYIEKYRESLKVKIHKAV